MANSLNKRKATNESSSGKVKKQKNWHTPKKANWSKAGKEIHIGDAGIWVTCDRGREEKAAAEVLDLLGEYFQEFSDGPSAAETLAQDETNDDGPSDIEQAISSELNDMKKPGPKDFFTVIRPDMECVVFIKTRAPVDPVTTVHTICKEAASITNTKRSRFVRRLTPATSTEKAHERNFEDLATSILKPVFHEDDSDSKKFAIRFSSRNHSILTRDQVIKKTAALVGSKHKVDLEHPDVIILIEIYKNICTMAVVDGDYNNLKRYNLSEITNARDQSSSNFASRFVKANEQNKNAKQEFEGALDDGNSKDGKGDSNG